VAFDELGIGIIGVGGIAMNHMDAYKKRGFKVLAGMDLSAMAFEEVKSKFGIPILTKDLDEFLAVPGLKVVDICVPHYFELRKPVFEAVAKSGKAIYCQKPMSETLAESLALVRIAEKAGVPFMMNQNAMFVPGFVAAKRILKNEPKFGKAYYFQIENRAPLWFTEHPHWGKRERWIMSGMAVHHCALAYHWFGMPRYANCLMAKDLKRPFIKGENVAALMLEYDSGLKGMIINNWAYQGPSNRSHPREEIVVQGSRGDLTIDSKKVIFETLQPGSREESDVEGDWFNDAFGETMGHFLESLTAKTRFISSGREDLKIMAVVEAAYRSSAERRVVDVAELLAKEGT
jgi:predicted dehydrogenase